MRARLSRLGLWLGSLLLVGLANLIAPFSILRGSERGWGVAQANDQALNAALGGSPREYLSTACARAKVAGKWWGRWSCRIFDLVDPGHCEQMLGEAYAKVTGTPAALSPEAPVDCRVGHRTAEE